MISFRKEDDYEDFHNFMLQQQQEYEEWMESEEGIRTINAQLVDAAYEDMYEIEVQ